MTGFIKRSAFTKKYGYEVFHIGYSEEAKKYITDNGIHIIQIKRINKGDTLCAQISSLKQSWMQDLLDDAMNKPFSVV